MATRQDLLQHLWHEVINVYLREDAINNIVRNSNRNPNGPFGDTGKAIEQMLDAGVSRRDLALAFRNVAYEAVFETLYSLDDPGVDEDEVLMLHEELLTSDPSGMEGRPGSSEID